MKKLNFMSLIFVGSIYSAVDSGFNTENAFNDEYRAVQNSYFAFKNDTGNDLDLIIELKNGDKIGEVVPVGDFTLLAVPVFSDQKSALEQIKDLTYYWHGKNKSLLSFNHKIDINNLLKNAYSRLNREGQGFGVEKKYIPSHDEVASYASKYKLTPTKAEAKLILLNSLYDKISTVTIQTQWGKYSESYDLLPADKLIGNQIPDILKDVLYIKKPALNNAKEASDKEVYNILGEQLIYLLNNNSKLKDLFKRVDLTSFSTSARYILNASKDNISISSLRYILDLAKKKWAFIKQVAEKKYVPFKKNIDVNIDSINDLLKLSWEVLFARIKLSIKQSNPEKNIQKSELEKIKVNVE